MLKVNTKKHLDDLIKDRDSWKANCCKIWKGVSPVLDLISPELPESQPRAPQLTPVEKAQRAWDWLQQFVKDAGEFAGAHVLSMVRAHYPLVDLSRLEKGYPKELPLVVCFSVNGWFIGADIEYNIPSPGGEYRESVETRRVRRGIRVIVLVFGVHNLGGDGAGA